MRYCLMCIKFQLCKTKGVLEMSGGDGRTSLQMYFIPLSVHLEMIKMVNIMLYVFYHTHTHTHTHTLIVEKTLFKL